MTRILLLLATALLALSTAFAADVNGKWTATFETQIGTQNYTYEFKVEGGKLTGTAKSANGESKITEGQVDGDMINFVENLTYEGQTMRVTYSGKISGDEIKFHRNVAEIADEELVAKRVK